MIIRGVSNFLRVHLLNYIGRSIHQLFQPDLSISIECKIPNVSGGSRASFVAGEEETLVSSFCLYSQNVRFQGKGDSKIFEIDDFLAFMSKKTAEEWFS